MPQHSSSHRTEETAVLVRAVENQLRKLVRFLVGRIPLVKLLEIIRYIFIEEIEIKLRKEKPTKNVSLSQLALLSGLDTRTLTKIRNNPKYRRPFHSEDNFLKEFVPGASIIDVWSNKAPYINSKTGKPKKLRVSGKKPSFESLFLESTTSRGVTYKSLLRRLVDSNIASQDENGEKIELVLTSYLPSASKDKLGAIEVGFSALSSLTDTVTKNICALETGNGRLFQRGAWTYRLDPERNHQLRSELNELLETTDKKARKIIARYEETESNSAQLTAGVGLYYFEE